MEIKTSLRVGLEGCGFGRTFLGSSQCSLEDQGWLIPLPSQHQHCHLGVTYIYVVYRCIQSIFGAPEQETRMMAAASTCSNAAHLPERISIQTGRGATSHPRPKNISGLFS